MPAVDGAGQNPTLCARAVELAGGRVRCVDLAAVRASADGMASALDGVGGLLVPDGCGDASESDGGGSGGGKGGLLELLAAALVRDLPVLATGSGMHTLNAVFGGGPAGAIGNHDLTERHQIYLSPGSKVAAIIGSAGMFRVNSRHRYGLREAQRAGRLMSIAYQLDDGVIEGLESKEHGWVIGVQFLPERGDEVPAAFKNLFLGLVERAGDYAGGNLG